MPGDLLDRDDLIRGIKALVSNSTIFLRSNGADPEWEVLYSSGGISDKALRLLRPIFEQGLPAIPEVPPPPDST